MEWNEEAVARLRELWTQGLSTAEIGRHLNVTKNAVVGKAHRLGLEGRPSPIRRAAVKKDKVTPVAKTESKAAPVEKPAKVVKPKAEKAEKVEKTTKEKLAAAISVVKKEADSQQFDMITPVGKKEVKPKKTKIDFTVPVELPKRRSMSDCCWPIGDPGTKDFHFCGAKAVPGKPYCLEHVQVAYVKLRDRKSNVA
ncbi:GcrA family cell cycle regulator [Commensalibacter papalotli (ex Botero et al. 2024)]|uniref:Uncharacterized conserved protein (PDB:5YIU) n=1 Tax=Commensalibacter papalotli (ex Botero et al. 2024) TaxID=2972766 RepID=A0ABM9HTF7_9PROT|nr:GcrA family cell cycle regulator [Commensalibacter papalotli (ex Botero et al. 2024)]CAI3954430.1 Uncharacterized conserved protein (PDB:5YIU) [Commensalibacter papalotli (ex Botero et al. 2024)]CAI3954941.1 Uncharacterized conserved protein (PDB:5YIU) [Commensalibacter papalotli (ex Botero et al. 2024)]